MRVLVVEDDVELGRHLCQLLASNKAQMVPTHVNDGLMAKQVLERAKAEGQPFDAVVMDLTLPGMDGLDVLRSMRSRGDMSPVCVLSARGSLADRVEGLEIGADYYLSKPFEDEELIACLRNISRRAVDQPSHVLTLGNLALDTARGLFTVDGGRLELPAKQAAMLQLLMRRKGAPVPKDLLCNIDANGMSQEAVDKAMSRIRIALANSEANVRVVNDKGIGYSLAVF